MSASLAASCSAAEPPVQRVREILAQCKQMLGKPVRAAGYLADCAGYSCYLYADKAGLEAEQRAFEDETIARRQAMLSGNHEEERKAFERRTPIPVIGIGGDEAFDRQAKPFQFSYVVITGRVEDETCTGAGGLDRSSGIEPTAIRAWTPSEGAPTDSPAKR